MTYRSKQMIIFSTAQQRLFGLVYNYFMSNQELPVLKNLRQSLEKEAVQTVLTAKKNRPSLTQPASENKKEEQQSTEVQQQNKEQPKIVVDENKFFTKKPSIFGVKSENNAIGNIFANRKSVNLFNITNNPSNQNPTLNIFTLASSSQPVIKNETEDDLLSQGSSGPEDNAKEQVLKQPEQKVMKYSYEDKFMRLGDFNVVKFKNGGAATKEGKMLVSLEKQKESHSKITYLILRSGATKVTLYQGILLTNVKIEHFLNKEQNIKLWVIHLHKKEQNTVTEREILKIQFENVEEAKRFEEIIVQREEKKENKKEE